MALNKRIFGVARKLLRSILVVLAIDSAWAEDLIEIYQLALQNDATFQAAQAAYLAAREAKPQARSFLLPQVSALTSFEYSGQTVERSVLAGGGFGQEFDTTRYALNVNQVIFNRDLAFGLKQADVSVAQAEVELEAARQDLLLRTASAYFDVLATQDTLRFTTSEKEALARQFEQAEKRFEVGLIAITDVKEAEAAYARAVADEITAGNDVDITRNALAVIIGQFFGELSTLSDRMPLITPEPEDADKWMQKAMQENLTLVAQRLVTEIASLEIKRQRAGHYPTIDLVASATQDNVGGGFLGGRDIGTIRAGVQLNVPIYTGGLVNSRTREAQQDFHESQELTVQQRRDSAQAARDSYLDVIAGISRVKALARAVESGQAAVEATEAGFEVGTRTSVDVTLALRNLFEAQRDYAVSRYTFLVDTLRLKEAAGILTASDLSTINTWLD